MGICLRRLVLGAFFLLGALTTAGFLTTRGMVFGGRGFGLTTCLTTFLTGSGFFGSFFSGCGFFSSPGFFLGGAFEGSRIVMVIGFFSGGGGLLKSWM